MPQQLAPIFYSVLAGLATILGIYLVIWKEKWALKNSIYLVSFAAGILISTSFAHLIPQGFELNKNIMLWVLLSFLFFYFIEHSILWHECQDGRYQTHKHHLGKIAFLSLAIHSLIDGVIIGVGFEVSKALGIIATTSVILHELPEGVTSVSLMLHSGFSRERSILLSWLVALATPFGALITLLLLSNLSASFLGALIGIAAGSFIYVGATDLLPEIHKKVSFKNVALIILGVLFPFVIEKLL